MAMQSFDQRKRLDRIVKDLGQIGDVTVSHDMAILSLVGRNMRHAIGSAGAMFTSLARAMINIEMISQGYVASTSTRTRTHFGDGALTEH